MTPRDLFKADADLGLCTKRPPKPPVWDAWYEWRKGTRLICASFNGPLAFISMLDGESATLTEEQRAELLSLARADLKWEVAGGHSYLTELLKGAA